MSIAEMVLLLDFKQGTDPELVSFTQIVLIRTKGVAAYAPVSALVTDAEDAYNVFIQAVSAAISGGKDEKDVRDQKRALLEDALEALGNGLIANSGGDPLYVTNTTFKLRSTDFDRSQEDFEAPLWKYLRRGALSGTLKGEVQSMPHGGRGLLVQWRIVGKETYTPADLANGKRVELTGLPPMTRVEVQVKYFGTHNRFSDWSIPFPIDVL